MQEILQVPLKLAKEHLHQIIDSISTEDKLEYSTHWTKEAGDTRLFKQLNLTILKDRDRKHQ